ncbi:hypothetical protein CPLU01_07630 [Colletotrichum plurivorum]|uniref:Uncharacterized protein n=1 Tax=Colletotrichum plurivorum TaxID=2175906 RepID=A0A8H6NEV4_9PEZI|nr:hypothetical protein CPLU01_07630 [Colletotrichum plurivorum]
MLLASKLTESETEAKPTTSILKARKHKTTFSGTAHYRREFRWQAKAWLGLSQGCGYTASLTRITRPQHTRAHRSQVVRFLTPPTYPELPAMEDQASQREDERFPRRARVFRSVAETLIALRGSGFSDSATSPNGLTQAFRACARRNRLVEHPGQGFLAEDSFGCRSCQRSRSRPAQAKACWSELVSIF